MGDPGERGVHRPVLQREAVAALAVKADGFYVDGTFGRGGHAALILEQLGPQGRLWLIDKDPVAVTEAQARFGADSRCLIHHGSFTELRVLAERHGVIGQIDGLLLDLGVSSPQLDEAARGFSFLRDGPLDMRMDSSRGLTAAQWLASAEADEIARVLRVYGEERFAWRIAQAIVARREQGGPLTTTGELAELIAAAAPTRERHKHPATRSFQAIRIFLNSELEDLSRILADACDLLAPGGRLAVISFHSLEDRIVKRFMRDHSGTSHVPPELPVIPEELRPKLKLVGKAIQPGAAEIAANPRARSAVLRVAERLP
ncbi:MAG TPA: 16S rRNA (cytosine(1402)-N(4))-methyltransferase RsmH [Gammaproteobacteria bacterium]|nr:16S rRNA (cytosine(1402)-N(4))-methyltransferase RsmH [Gammaproteobacteria bacterium]